MKRNAVTLNIENWEEATKALRANARGWLFSLLMYDYQNDGLPEDIEELASIAKVRPSEYESFIKSFENEISSILTENSIINQKKEYHNSRRQSGKMGYVMKFIRENEEFDAYDLEEIKDKIYQHLDFEKTDFSNKKKLENVLKNLLKNHLKNDLRSTLRSTYRSTLRSTSRSTLGSTSEGDLTNSESGDKNSEKSRAHEGAHTCGGARLPIVKDISRERDLDKPVKKEKEKTWKTDFDLYAKECSEAYEKLYNDKDFISEQERLNPGIDVPLSIEKGFRNFWGTEAGWRHKKRARTKTINWRLTIANSIMLNRVYKPRS